MHKKFMVRFWQEIDIKDVKPSLFIAGSTMGDCGNCKEVGIPFDAKNCPKCGTVFKYMGTRLTASAGEARRLKTKRPDLMLLDFKDFKEAEARIDARGFLGD